MHHVAYRARATAAWWLPATSPGVRIGDGPILPPTPPPDIDVEAWHASIDRIAAWEPTALAITHFGTFDADVAQHLETLHEELDRWAEVARRTDAAGFEAEIRAALAGSDQEQGVFEGDAARHALRRAGRYWQKRDTAAS